MSSIDKLYRAAQQEGSRRVTRDEVNEFLKGQDVYTLHKPAPKNCPRNPILAVGINEIHDLVDVSNLSRYNRGFKFLLTRIDVFSKYARVIPLKSKTGKALVKAFKTNIESSGRPPVMIHTDKGTEFTNHACSK